MSMLTRKFKTGGLIITGVAVVFVVLLVAFGLGRNNDQNWQIIQSVTGNVEIRDTPGWYVKAFASVWTWPRAQQKYFSASVDEGGSKDESVRVTFNDGGQAQMSIMIRVQTPVTVEQRRALHRDFGGNPENMMHAVRAHLINCAKATAPLMSASEHQSARKAEFTQLVNEQLINGLYEMRKIEKELKDRTDQNGKPITVFATEIVLDKNGKPVIAQKSPLDVYGIEVLQFSVTDTDYDPQTLAQFSAKKESFLAAEKSKAQREQEVQQRLMIVEKGLREKAEVEAQANKEMAGQVIAATRDKEVARLAAMKKVEVADQERQEQEALAKKAIVEAERDKAVAALKLESAKLDGESKIVLAAAKQKEIELAGFITEKERVLREIARDEAIGVAAAHAKVNVPSIIVTGGDGDNGTDPIKLFGLKMLRDIEASTSEAPKAQ